MQCPTSNALFGVTSKSWGPRDLTRAILFTFFGTNPSLGAFELTPTCPPSPLTSYGELTTDGVVLAWLRSAATLQLRANTSGPKKDTGKKPRRPRNDSDDAPQRHPAGEVPPDRGYLIASRTDPLDWISLANLRPSYMEFLKLHFLLYILCYMRA